MALYDWKEILAEYYQKSVGIVANGPSIVQHQTKGASFVGVPGNIKEDVVQHTTDFTTFPHDIWTVNGGWFYHPGKCTLGWNMDDMKAECMNEHPQVDWYYSLFEGNDGIPIFSALEYPEWPRVVAFPLEEALLATRMAYFTETLQYMLAFCYMAKVKEVHCYGMDYMNTDRQPGQRANTEWWLGFLHHAGIKTKISPYSNLMKAPVIEPFHTGFYGYEHSKPLPIDLEAVNKRILAGETWEYQKEM
ncbi:hypothetical protein HOD41_07400 [bacterium]|jgi:hypothetical protein|nr:hypothetical protein [bacterium]